MGLEFLSTYPYKSHSASTGIVWWIAWMTALFSSICALFWWILIVTKQLFSAMWLLKSLSNNTVKKIIIHTGSDKMVALTICHFSMWSLRVFKVHSHSNFNNVPGNEKSLLTHKILKHWYMWKKINNNLHRYMYYSIASLVKLLHYNGYIIYYNGYQS